MDQFSEWLFFLFPSPSYCHFCYIEKVARDLPSIAPTQYWLMLKPVTDCSGLGKQTFVAFNGGWIRDPNIQDTYKGLLEAIRLRPLSKKKKKMKKLKLTVITFHISTEG